VTAAYEYFVNLSNENNVYFKVTLAHFDLKKEVMAKKGIKGA